MELQTNSGQKVKLRIDIATRTRIDALGAPMLPCLKRGANVSSAIFDVTSLKNWLCHAYGYIYFLEARLTSCMDGAVNISNCSAVSFIV